MNHGVVLFARPNIPHAAIWQMAMSRGQFIAIYTSKSLAGSTDWSSALVPTVGEPLRFPSHPDLGGNYHDYARYEPAYDEQFGRMCNQCFSYFGWPTVALPATASDQEALRLLGDLEAIEAKTWPYFYERFYLVRRQKLRKPKKSDLKLADLLKPLRLNDGWAYFLGFFRSGDGVVVFLSDNQPDVENLFTPADAGQSITRQAEWLEYHGVIEKW